MHKSGKPCCIAHHPYADCFTWWFTTSRRDLEKHLQSVSPLPLNLWELMGCMVCPARHCRQPLSQADLHNLVAPNAVEKASPSAKTRCR